MGCAAATGTMDAPETTRDPARHSDTPPPQPGRATVPPGTDVRSRAGEPADETEADPAVPGLVIRVTRRRTATADADESATPPRESVEEGNPNTLPEPAEAGTPSATPETIPARMLNEFVYCPRLFYYEFVEGVFVHNADTLRGKNLHRRVDKGAGELPPAGGGQKSEGSVQKAAQVEPSTTTPQPSTDEVIHSRSVNLGSATLGVTAKLDLVEVRTAQTGEEAIESDLFRALEVCPVDYKAGAPKESEEGAELWDADRMQLGLQMLLLRENGYTCHEGIIYYRATKQRVRLPFTPELEAWVTERVAAARRCAAGAIPSPLVNSPKCPRCSLVTVCLPDETRLLSAAAEEAKTSPRRLMAARDDARALYLNTPGLRVGRKEELLQIKQERETLDEVRLNDLSHVALFGNIQISTQAVQSLCEAEIPVSYFSMGGWFYGLTRGHELKNVFLRIEQFRLAREPEVCLRLARQFVQGKIRNHRTLLMRNHLEPPPATVLKLKQHADLALRAGSLAELLGVEGGAAAAYFEQFSGMIKTVESGDALSVEGAIPQPSTRNAQLTFNFTHRRRRPPTDPVNALLSLAYSLLAKDCTLAVLAVGFDPYVGFFHQPRFGRPALALDLMEEFRPLVAESTVLSAINNRSVTPGDFVRAGQAVNLSAAGRRRFFNFYEQRMNSLLTHPVFEYKVSYRRALELQARMLGKVLTGEIPEYVPLTTR